MDSIIHRSRRLEIDEAGMMPIKSKNIKELVEYFGRFEAAL